MVDEKKEITDSGNDFNYYNITEFLVTLTTVEYADLIVKGRDIIHGLGYDGINNEFDAIMRTRFNRSTEDLLSDVNLLMNNVLDEILKAHGISLQINTPIYIKIDLLDTLSKLMDYYDPEQLLSSFQLGVTEDPMDVFADILEELIGEDSADDLMCYIKTVNKSLLKTIKTQLETMVNASPPVDLYEVQEVTEDLINNIRNVTSFIINGHHLILPKKLGNTLPVKLPIDFYFAEIVNHYKESESPHMVAAECVIAAIASGCSIEKIESEVSGYLSYFYLQESKQLEVSVAIRSLIGAISDDAK